MFVPGYEGTQPELTRHFAELQRLIARARAYLAQGRREAAAVYAEIAANYAMCKHPGLFVSPSLERLLLCLGGAPVRGAGRPRLRTSAAPRHVLHVLTRAYGIGGDSRMVWRWIREDSGRAHSVVLTRQGAAPAPSALRAVVADSGGQLSTLNERRGGILAWAAQLRRLAAAADLVVLHVHPYDVIPAIALADKAVTPPVVYVNHADHVFWAGAAVTDLLADLRTAGARLSLERRAFDGERSALLPIALGPIDRTMGRAEAKLRLGLPEASVVLLSIARSHKYAPFAGLGYAEALVPLLKAYPQAHLLVVGPEQDGPWQAAAAQTGGRVRAFGYREDTAVFYQAADIYLDSFPLISITSLLEAGSYATPLVSRSPQREPLGVLGSDTPALERCLLRAADLEQLRAILGQLIERPDYRRQVGETTRAAIAEVHMGQGWRRSLDELYRRAAAVRPNPGAIWTAERPRAEELDLLLTHLFDDEPGLEQILQFHLRLMPLDLRLQQWSMLTASGGVSPGLLLPEWLGTSVERWRRSRPN